MLGRTYDGQNCSVAKSLELIGERWTMLVVREAFYDSFAKNVVRFSRPIHEVRCQDGVLLRIDRLPDQDAAVSIPEEAQRSAK